MSCNICTRYKIILRIIILFNFMAFWKGDCYPTQYTWSSVEKGGSIIRHPPGSNFILSLFSAVSNKHRKLPRMILNFYVYYIKDNGVIFRCVKKISLYTLLYSYFMSLCGWFFLFFCVTFYYFSYRGKQQNKKLFVLFLLN